MSDRSFPFVTRQLIPLLGERFGGGAGEVVELMRTPGGGGEIGRLVRELEEETGTDGVVWREVPRGDKRVEEAKGERIP